MTPQASMLKADFSKKLATIGADYSLTELAQLANIGTILLTLWQMEEFKEEQVQEVRDDITEELQGAEKYYKRYLDTGDSTYKSLARDELHHAAFFINHAKMVANTPSERTELEFANQWHDQLLEKLS